jgi:hypothetical protein
MVRWPVVVLLVLTTAPATRAQVISAKVQIVPEIQLIQAEPLDGPAFLWVSQQGGYVRVQVSPTRARGGASVQTVADVALQVWVLTSDGTALARHDRSTLPLAYRMGGLWFDATEPTRLSAVVVSINGALFVRPIPTRPMN